MQTTRSALADHLAQVRRQVLVPAPTLTLVEWADEYRYLSSEASANPGRWKTSRVEVARGPMMAFTDPAVQIITLMCATQLLKTELLLNTLGYIIDKDPGPTILVINTKLIAKAVSRDRVDTMIRDSPAIKSKVAQKRSMDGGNEVLHKSFTNGSLTLVGANEPGDLASRPVRYILCDEIDKYPESAGEEGDPISLVIERSASFWNRKVLQTCSPTIEGKSRIALEYLAGDQRVFEPPCPFCGHREELKFIHVKWKKNDPDTARYQCPSCEEMWTDLDRIAAINATCFLPGYGWRATAPFNGHASFRVSKLASPWTNDRLSEIVRKFIKAKDKPALLKTFVNTQLAETYKERGDAPPWKSLYDRREHYPINSVPAGVLLIYCGVDVQKDRLELEIVGYGANIESWSIDYRVIPGDVTDETTDRSPWKKLTELLSETWFHASGAPMKIRSMGVDCQYETQTVLRWVRKNQVGDRVRAVRGHENHATAIGQPLAVDVSIDGLRKKRGLKQWPIGSNLLKSELYGFLRQETPNLEEKQKYPRGFCHFPQYAEEFFKQITAEEIVKRVVRGYTLSSWEKTRDRNEALDCRNYARAMALLDGIDRLTDADWHALAVELGAAVEAEPELLPVGATLEQVGDITIVRTKSKFWNRDRD